MCKHTPFLRYCLVCLANRCHTALITGAASSSLTMWQQLKHAMFCQAKLLPCQKCLAANVKALWRPSAPPVSASRIGRHSEGTAACGRVQPSGHAAACVLL